MGVYFSPHKEVTVVASSVGPLLPISDGADDGRLAYFLYYSHGVDPGPWEFWLQLAVSIFFCFDQVLLLAIYSFPSLSSRLD